MIRKLFILIFPFFIPNLHSVQFGIDAKHEGGENITHFKVYGERCSGTNYLARLLGINFPLSENTDYSWKHFPPWFAHPKDPMLSYPDHFYTFEGGEQTLFVVVFRSPYDWVRSLRCWPHHASQKLFGLSLDEFVHQRWEAGKGENANLQRIELDPETGNSFPNVLKLRTAKIRNMLLIKDLVDHIYFVNYEVLKNHPEEVMREIGEVFGIEVTEEFKKIDTYKGLGEEKFKEKRYPKIHLRTLRFLNSQLDWELENSIGYEKKENERQFQQKEGRKSNF